MTLTRPSASSARWPSLPSSACSSPPATRPTSRAGCTGSTRSSWLAGINDAGIAVGTWGSSGAIYDTKPRGRRLVFPPAGWFELHFTDINDAGLAVGYLVNYGPQREQAFVYNSKTGGSGSSSCRPGSTSRKPWPSTCRPGAADRLAAPERRLRRLRQLPLRPSRPQPAPADRADPGEARHELDRERDGHLERRRSSSATPAVSNVCLPTPLRVQLGPADGRHVAQHARSPLAPGVHPQPERDRGGRGRRLLAFVQRGVLRDALRVRPTGQEVRLVERGHSGGSSHRYLGRRDHVGAAGRNIRRGRLVVRPRGQARAALRKPAQCLLARSQRLSDRRRQLRPNRSGFVYRVP